MNLFFPAVMALALAVAAGLHFGSNIRPMSGAEAHPTPTPPARPRTTIGVNLFGLDTFNRQQVFANMVLQSEWFQSRGRTWTPMPSDQIDAQGWVTRLLPGQTAPRPLVLPTAPFRPTPVRCTYLGKGEMTAGGVARLIDSAPHRLDLMLTPTGAEGEGGWIELVRTDPHDPLRAIDCRIAGTPPGARFDPRFVEYASDFGVLRFMDWQRVNDNPRIAWSDRTSQQAGSQVGPAGASVEDMVDLADMAKADPWFTMPFHADDEWIRAFAQLVHDRINPDATIYVELGNEVWNDIFAASRDAQSEGLARGLGKGDPARARMERYAQRMITTMRIWSEVFADRPGALVRVCATQHANPALARMVLEYADSAKWVDALATAPYIWIDLDGHSATDTDRVFGAAPGAVERTFAMAASNRAIAEAYGKRYITYEGGQHLVTQDLELARAIQRDPRMDALYVRYLSGWRDRFGDTLNLYASTAPIGQHGSWGLSEYAGQPLAEAPKYRALLRFLETNP